MVSGQKFSKQQVATLSFFLFLVPDEDFYLVATGLTYLVREGNTPRLCTYDLRSKKARSEMAFLKIKHKKARYEVPLRKSHFFRKI